MRIKIKKYQKNNVEDFDRCMIELQDFLVKIDPLQRLRRAANYSPQYANNVINKAAHNFYQQLNYQNRLIDMIKPLK